MTDAETFAGQCYAASEALYHLLGRKAAGLTPMCLRLVDGSSPWRCHWFLVTADGQILDPTREQFSERPAYELARGKGFLTKHPSGRARRIMETIEERNLL